MNIRRNGSNQVGEKNETAFEYPDKRDRAGRVFSRDLPTQFFDAAPDFFLCYQNRAQRRFHSAVSLWYKRGRFQRGHPMLRKAFVLLVLSILTAASLPAQTTSSNQQRPRSNDFAIRGKVIIPNSY